MATLQEPPGFEQVGRLRESISSGIDGIVQWAIANPTSSTIAIGVVLVSIIAVYLFLSSWYEDRYGPEAEKVLRRHVGKWRAARFINSAGSQPRERWQTWKLLGQRYEAEFAVLFSGSGTGKSLRILIQHLVITIKAGTKSVIGVDPKGELYGLSRPFLWLLNAVGTKPLVSRLSTDPKVPDDQVPAIDVFADQTTARNFLWAVYARRMSKDQIWEEAAIDLALAVRRVLGGADLVEVYDTISDVTKLDELAQANSQVAAEWPGSQLKGSHHDARKNFTAPFSGLQEPQIRRLFDRGRMGSAPEPGLFAEPEFIFLSFRQSDSKIAAPIMSGLVGVLQTRAAQREEGTPDVEILGDEAGTSYPVALITDYLQMCRGAGVHIFLCFQDYAQLRSKLDIHEADSIIGNCELLIIGWTRSEETKALAESQSGQCFVTRESPDGTKREVERARLLHEHPQERLGSGAFYVFYRGQPATKVKHKPVYQQYRQRVEPKEQGEIRLNVPSPSTTVVDHLVMHRAVCSGSAWLVPDAGDATATIRVHLRLSEPSPRPASTVAGAPRGPSAVT